MITRKEELKNEINNRDIGQVKRHLDNIEAALRKNWTGDHKISVGTEQQTVPSHVVDHVLREAKAAGWDITYTSGGSDQREGSWNGHWTVG